MTLSKDSSRRLKNFEELLKKLTPIVPLEEARMYAAAVGFEWVFDALIEFRDAEDNLR